MQSEKSHTGFLKEVESVTPAGTRRQQTDGRNGRRWSRPGDLGGAIAGEGKGAAIGAVGGTGAQMLTEDQEVSVPSRRF